jgi:hypothetical protein
MDMTVTNVVQEPAQLPATLDKIESAIALASNPEEINKVLALMDAAVAYAKRFYKDQQDIIQRAKGLKLQAERKLGELLRTMPKASAGRPVEIGSKAEPINRGAPTLAEIGIDKKTSMRAQRLAALPEQKFAAVMAGEIPVAKAIASPPKKATARSKANDAIQEAKVITATEGGTYLITSMRNAYNAIDAAGDHIEEQEKAIAMAKKLAIRLSDFITKFEGNPVSL